MRVFAATAMALGLCAIPAMAAGGGTANNNADPAAPKAPAAEPAAKSASKPAEAEMETELQQLRDAIAMQAQQIQDQQKKMQQLEEQLKATSAGRDNLSASPAVARVATPAAPAASAANAEMAPPATAAVARSAASISGGSGGRQASVNEGPASWAYKGVTFTPIGYFAAETVWRQRALSADINTPFSSDPMPGSSQYNMSEFNASGRQSRIGMLVQGKLGTAKIGGYYEADFLSAGTTSNDNQSNSYTLRQRQFWAQAAFDSGLTITGGQMWSLVTQTAKGVDPRTELLPETIDAQYQVGFSWARQYGVRIAKVFNNKMWLAAAVEEPQTTFKVGGTVTTPYLLGAAGNGGGLYNTAQSSYSFNMTPDFVFKAAFEPGFGHYEVFGLISTFRDRIFAASGPYNASAIGGGGGANAWFPFESGRINLGFHVLAGDGVGRYGAGGAAPDATVNPNGQLQLIRSYQGLGTLAFHYPKWDVYFHLGGEYAGRSQFISGGGTIPNEGFGAIGFNNAGCWTEVAAGSGGFTPGSLANCAGNVRNIIEGTAGVWYTFYQGPKGTFKFGAQYSYEDLNTWAGVGGTGVCTNAAHPGCGPNTNENMFFTSMRYYIP